MSTPTQPLDIEEETVEIESPAARLTGVLAYPLIGRPKRAALIVGPHPLMGGRLENNVVRQVGRGLAERAFATLRFEFDDASAAPDVMAEFWRTGHAPDDPQRAVDSRAALDWLSSVCTGPILLIGYSFGASLLAGLLNERSSGVVLIGATFAQHDYRALAASSVSKLVIAADNDFATPMATTEKWVATATDPKRLVVMPAAEHFYRGHEGRIVEEILQWLPR